MFSVYKIVRSSKLEPMLINWYEEIFLNLRTILMIYQKIVC